MAENATTTLAGGVDSPPAQLRAGRPADPAEVTQSDLEKGGDAGQAEATATVSGEQSDQSSPGAEDEQNQQNDEYLQAKSELKNLRLMLRQCDRVLLLDFDLLSMSDWPDNYSLAQARRSRDLWLLSAVVAAAVFLSGLTGFVPAWVAGGGFGACVIILLLGVPFIRRIYTNKPSYLDLIWQRQRMLSDARKHVAHLEGDDGLVWQCARMAGYNASLRHGRFSDMVRLSEQRVLPRYLTKREHFRLYLIYMLEAERAYNKIQQAFFDGNQAAIDKGWQEVAAAPEPRA
ncbi:hypothetical protein DOQ08_00576 [Marinobacter litoralis]|uniref:Uncharacterized protein n=1 Tax=Marinobacter litoralis TaxID=187981 RepID=A0A3M2RKM6_9GAMM|nr:hypothetical protein [Marinobacter litoralis]RMJ05900.1 hypothetical protein DOQ08_00576 [Marinobacter litoralis]